MYMYRWSYNPNFHLSGSTGDTCRNRTIETWHNLKESQILTLPPLAQKSKSKNMSPIPSLFHCTFLPPFYLSPSLYRHYSNFHCKIHLSINKSRSLILLHIHASKDLPQIPTLYLPPPIQVLHTDVFPPLSSFLGHCFSNRIWVADGNWLFLPTVLRCSLRSLWIQ